MCGWLTLKLFIGVQPSPAKASHLGCEDRVFKSHYSGHYGRRKVQYLFAVMWLYKDTQETALWCISSVGLELRSVTPRTRVQTPYTPPFASPPYGCISVQRSKTYTIGERKGWILTKLQPTHQNIETRFLTALFEACGMLLSHLAAHLNKKTTKVSEYYMVVKVRSIKQPCSICYA